MARLDKETKEILEKKDLSLEEFSVEVSMRQSGYAMENDDNQIISVSFYDNFESDEEIGYANFFLYDANVISVSDIRDIADGYSFDQYQSLSSVRIYQDAAEADFDKVMGFEHDNENTPWFGIHEMAKATGINPFSYSKGYEQGTFEGRRFHPNTKSVWGRILVLHETSIREEYRTNAITKVLFQNMLKCLRNIGLDWVIVNPNINEEYMKMNKYPLHTQKSYKTFLSKLGFELTKGRLRDNDSCYCYQLQI